MCRSCNSRSAGNLTRRNSLKDRWPVPEIKKISPQEIGQVVQCSSIYTQKRQWYARKLTCHLFIYFCTYLNLNLFHCYSSSCCCPVIVLFLLLVGTTVFTKAPLFQIGSGWNSARLFLANQFEDVGKSWLGKKNRRKLCHNGVLILCFTMQYDRFMAWYCSLSVCLSVCAVNCGALQSGCRPTIGLKVVQLSRRVPSRRLPINFFRLFTVHVECIV